MKHLLRCVLIGFLCGFLVKLFALDIPKVSGTSMEPALHDGERICISKLAYGLVIPFGSSTLISWGAPKAGDIIVYMYDGEMVVKRCAASSAMPLDYSCDNGYTLKVGGEEIPLTEEQYRLLKNITQVPEGTVLAVGDNYAASIDSRSYGFIPERDVLGKVLWK